MCRQVGQIVLYATQFAMCGMKRPSQWQSAQALYVIGSLGKSSVRPGYPVALIIPSATNVVTAFYAATFPGLVRDLPKLIESEKDVKAGTKRRISSPSPSAPSFSLPFWFTLTPLQSRRALRARLIRAIQSKFPAPTRLVPKLTPPPAVQSRQHHWLRSRRDLLRHCRWDLRRSRLRHRRPTHHLLPSPHGLLRRLDCRLHRTVLHCSKTSTGAAVACRDEMVVGRSTVS